MIQIKFKIQNNIVMNCFKHLDPMEFLKKLLVTINYLLNTYKKLKGIIKRRISIKNLIK